jgi:hypothetical protein
MTSTAEKFFSLLRYSLGEQQQQPVISDDEWEDINVTAAEQSLTGVLCQGVMRLSAVTPLPDEVRLAWFLQTDQIAEANKRLNVACFKVAKRLRKDGYDCCILKGQGNALMYPNPFARIPGDIDIWTVGDIRSIIELGKKSNPEARPVYHHIDFAPIGDIPVEVHYRPGFMHNLIHNRRMQRWFGQQAAEQCAHQVELPEGAGSVPVPTDAFNRIFQMAHISKHILHEGIGLRQIVDYYFLLKKGFTQEERQRDERLLRRFGLYGVATAVMYVLQEALGAPKQLMLVPADERKGRFLLDEMLLAGNFGQFDKRLANSHSQLSRNVQRLRRDLRFLTYFPSECLWEPVFRWYHFFWRLRFR